MTRTSKLVEELDLYKEYRHAYDKATELEFFDKHKKQIIIMNMHNN